MPNQDIGAMVNEAVEVVEKERQRVQGLLSKLEQEVDDLTSRLKAKQQELSTHETMLLHAERDMGRAIKQALSSQGIQLDAAATLGHKDGGNGRITKEETAKRTIVILGALPARNQQFMPIARIVKQTKMDGVQIKAGLTKLKREGQVVSNGMRGAGGGWRRA